MTKYVYNPFLFQPPFQLLLLSDNLSNGSVKFVAHHLYYKYKFVDNLTYSFVCVANSLYFIFNLRNLLAASLFACNGSTCIAKSGLVTKKEELQKTFIYFSHLF